MGFQAEDVLQTGKRIMNMRYAFNLREGQKPTDDDNQLPKRCVGEPPQTEAREGITVDTRSWATISVKVWAGMKRPRFQRGESLEKLGEMKDVTSGSYIEPLLQSRSSNASPPRIIFSVLAMTQTIRRRFIRGRIRGTLIQMQLSHTPYRCSPALIPKL